MSKKVKRVSVSLHPQKSGPLLNEEIKIILRGADDLIMEGGRSLLAKILKGSKDKTILEKGLNSNPVYGYFKGLSIYEITSKIDRLGDVEKYLNVGCVYIHQIIRANALLSNR